MHRDLLRRSAFATAVAAAVLAAATAGAEEVASPSQGAPPGLGVAAAQPAPTPSDMSLRADAADVAEAADRDGAAVDATPEEPDPVAGLIDARTILASVARLDSIAAADAPPSSVWAFANYRIRLAGLGVGAGVYRTLIEAEARRAGMPAEIAEAVMGVESSYNPRVVGAAGEIGLMQVLPSTARMLGFSGSLDELAVPETNIRYGVTYLAQAWRLAGGDLCTAVMKYRAGHGERRFSHRSVAYCLNVRARLAARGVPVSGRVPVATFGAPVASCRTCSGAAAAGIDHGALTARIVQDVAAGRPR